MTQPAASDIRVGAVLRDTYEITSLLGKGGMGTVFLARHRRLPGKQVAVKVLQNSASLNPELYARFRREAEIASQLGHPNIVEVLDFDTLQDGTPFLVMEYLRGESLEQRLSRGPLPRRRGALHHPAGLLGAPGGPPRRQSSTATSSPPTCSSSPPTPGAWWPSG